MTSYRIKQKANALDDAAEAWIPPAILADMARDIAKACELYVEDLERRGFIKKTEERCSWSHNAPTTGGGEMVKCEQLADHVGDHVAFTGTGEKIQWANEVNPA